MKRIILLLGVASCMLMSGCAVQTVVTSASAILVQGEGLHGLVHGGQQPVAGSVIQLYAAGSSGYGTASRALLSSTVVTGPDGSFAITGRYVCPSATTQVYLLASGGNPGIASGTNNSALKLMTALGPCGQLSAGTFISVNELTTVASVWALSPFMANASSVGTVSTNAQGLANAFATVSKLMDTKTGRLPGPALPPGASIPSAELNSLANVLAACINSLGGQAGDNSACGKLFSGATPASGTVPTNTVDAALNIAKHPSVNVSALYSLAPAASPFQPMLSSQPSDWTISINYNAIGLNAPKGATVDATGNIWIANPGSNTVAAMAASGVPLAGSPFSGGGLDTPQAIAFDAGGNAWIANKGGSSVTKLNSFGIPMAGSPYTGGGLNSPTSIAFDAAGNAWLSNFGNDSITELAPSGTALSPVTGYVGAGLSKPVAIAVGDR